MVCHIKKENSEVLRILFDLLKVVVKLLLIVVSVLPAVIDRLGDGKEQVYYCLHIAMIAWMGNVVVWLQILYCLLNTW